MTHIEIDKNFSFLEYNNKSTKFKIQFHQQQKGVFRVNCVDSLDRSNVTQSVMVREVIRSIDPLKKNLYENDTINKNFDNQLKIIWADNGDQLALSYTGTKALKGDYTRTGKKTIKGTLMDGVYSLQRYYLNNFNDGYHQDSNDYVLGKLTNFKVTKVNDHSTFYLKLIIITLIIISHYLGKYTVDIFLPIKNSDGFVKLFLRFFYSIFLFLFLTIITIFKNKESLFDKPTINHSVTKEKIY